MSALQWGDVDMGPEVGQGSLDHQTSCAPPIAPHARCAHVCGPGGGGGAMFPRSDTPGEGARRVKGGGARGNVLGLSTGAKRAGKGSYARHTLHLAL